MVRASGARQNAGHLIQRSETDITDATLNSLAFLRLGNGLSSGNEREGAIARAGVAMDCDSAGPGGRLPALGGFGQKCSPHRLAWNDYRSHRHLRLVPAAL